jgi:uncharacterized phage-associated protein
MLTATQVADWIVRYRAELGAPVDPMSLQKLLFYTQAFHLARHGEALFAEDFKAWVNGPVVPQVWHRYNADNATLINQPADDETPEIDDEVEARIGNTVAFFSRMTAFTLSDATHNEDPWIDARGGLSHHERSDNQIPTDGIRIYYASLLCDGENALSKQAPLDDIPEPRIGSFYRAGICVRGMKRHPLYSPTWEKALTLPMSPEPDVSDEMLAPVERRDFVSATSCDDQEEIKD